MALINILSMKDTVLFFVFVPFLAGQLNCQNEREGRANKVAHVKC